MLAFSLRTINFLYGYIPILLLTLGVKVTNRVDNMEPDINYFYPVDTALERSAFKRDSETATTPRQAREKSLEVANYQVMLQKQKGG